MIEQHTPSDGIARSARISPEGVYRYQLVRAWGPGTRYLCFVMLNPSTADAQQDDPTVRLCMEWARRLGFDGVCVVNLFAYRSTDPDRMILMRKHAGFDIVGPENNDAIVGSAGTASMVICAWGNNAAHRLLTGRQQDVIAMLRKLGITIHCLKLSKAGQPVHPLYQPFSLQPVVMA